MSCRASIWHAPCRHASRRRPDRKTRHDPAAPRWYFSPHSAREVRAHDRSRDARETTSPQHSAWNISRRRSPPGRCRYGANWQRWPSRGLEDRGFPLILPRIPICAASPSCAARTWPKLTNRALPRPITPFAPNACRCSGAMLLPMATAYRIILRCLRRAARARRPCSTRRRACCSIRSSGCVPWDAAPGTRIVHDIYSHTMDIQLRAARSRLSARFSRKTFRCRILGLEQASSRRRQAAAVRR